MASASNTLNLQSTPEVLEHMGDSPSKDLNDSNISPMESLQKVDKPSSEPDFEVSSLTADSQSSTGDGTDYIDTFHEDPIQATYSKQYLHVEENASRETCEKISIVTEDGRIVPPSKISNSAKLFGEMEKSQPTVSAETESTEIIQPTVSEETVSNEVILPVISLDSESTELIHSSISKETRPIEVTQRDVLEETESTKLINTAFSEETFENEVIQPALFNESDSNEVIQFSVFQEARSTKAVLPDLSEVNGSIKVVQPASSEVNGSTKEIQTASSEVNESAEVIKPDNSGKTKPNKVIEPASTKETLLNLNRSPMDSMALNSKKVQSSGTKNDQIPQKNVMNLSEMRSVSSEKVLEITNFMKQPNSPRVSAIELDNFSLFQIGDEFQNGTRFIVSGAGCGGHVTASPSPLFKPIFPDFEMPPMLPTTNLTTMDSQRTSNVSTSLRDMSSKTPLSSMDSSSSFNDSALPKDLSSKISLSTLDSSSPHNDSTIPKGIASKTSLYTLLSILVDWINTGMEKVFNRPKTTNIADLLNYVDKELTYGQNVLNHMNKRVDTLLIAVDGLPDPPFPSNLSCPRNLFRDCLNDAGAKVQRRLEALKAEITADYDKFVIVCRITPELNNVDFDYNQEEATALNIISNSYVKVSEEYSSLKIEIGDFRNKIQDFYWDIKSFL